MLIVCTKSAAALVLGGALLGQQADDPTRSNARPTIAPPAPTLQNEVDRRVNDQQAQQRGTQQVQQNIDQRAGDQRQTFQDQNQDRANAQIQHDQRQGDQQGRAALGVSVSDDLRITQVSPGSPAQRMGLRAGDEILSVNGQTFDSIDAFLQSIGSTPQGQQVQLEFDRNGQRMTQSGMLATWDQVHSGGAPMGGTQYGAGYSSSGVQNYSAMRYPSDGTVQGAPVGGQQFVSDACCDPCAGSGGFYDGGFGYGGGYAYGWDDGWGRRGGRRAARWGYSW